ncbi:MAG TPA: GntR family transcriptional regulator [Acetivibrio sp.]|jgi:DNA-binding GntR family transcriptional regulator|nr:GntR family transcriptional regulator [Bacillota bacterium]HQA59333.1 GntR family transcriptional regulator [Acetivibrio sp.]
MHNNFLTKSELVFDTLKKRIINGELEPGTELVISRLSEEFNVSTIPVREAIKTLASEGLVEIEPHKSAKVAEFNLEKLHQIITIRAGLEGYAARLAVLHINEIQLRTLENIVNKMKEAMLKSDAENFNLNNLKFHRYLYQIAPYPMLYEMIVKVWDGGKWTRSVFAISPKRMEKSIEEHMEIIRAIKNRDEDRVERLVREHRINAGKELEKNYKKR